MSDPNITNKPLDRDPCLRSKLKGAYFIKYEWELLCIVIMRS
jgi:hypothetical protein